MKSLVKASRVNIALQVIQHMNDGMKVVEACKSELGPTDLVPFSRLFLDLLTAH